jgi:LuxR family transcriptional regulator, regulator of acetate metabolism
VERNEVIAETLDLAALLIRLSDLGPPSEVRRQSARVAAEALGFDRVLLTGIVHGRLTAEALHGGDQPGELLQELRQRSVALDYPLVEGELMRRRRAEVVDAGEREDPRRHAFADVLGARSYVAAPIVLDGTVIGFFLADRAPSARDVGGDDADRLASLATCFALVYERAVLRHRLRAQREELRQVAGWAAARTGELDERSIALGEDDRRDDHVATVRTAGAGESALRELLTHRELDVMRLMVRGDTNAQIARELVLSEGTIKFHVKNILRKLHAANRAEATSRYLRLTLNRDSGKP